MRSDIYTIDMTEDKQPVVFVNGIVARTFQGWLWLMRHAPWIKRTARKAPGCVQINAGFCNIKEIVAVSYWENMDALNAYIRTEDHRKMMRYFHQNPRALSLYNEIYHPSQSGKYANEPNALALIYPKMPQNEKES